MLIGHIATGFAAKRVCRDVSLGILVMAAMFIDLLWPIFTLIGWESLELDPGNTAVVPINLIHYPWSHSLLFTLIWALLFGGIYYLIRRNSKASLLLGGLVIGHFLLDFITHRPDLPLTPYEKVLVGLGLWHSVIGTIVVEGGIFVLGLLIYIRNTQAKNRTGTYSLIGLIAFLTIIYFANIFGPPPPTADVVPYTALSMWLFVAWAFWIDRNRVVKPSLET